MSRKLPDVPHSLRYTGRPRAGMPIVMCGVSRYGKFETLARRPFVPRNEALSQIVIVQLASLDG